MTLTWRAVRLPEDLAVLHGVIEAVEEADGGPYRTSVDEVADLFDGRDLERDTLLVLDEGRAVAWGRVSHDVPDEPPPRDRVVLFGGVVGSCRGEGIGRALLDRQLARAEQIAAGSPVPVDVRVYEEAEGDGRAALAARRGLEPVRFFEELRRDLSPLGVATPGGVVVRPWEPADDEPARRVKNAAFRDHWGSTEATAEDWARDLAASTARRDLSRVAIADGRLVGLLGVDHYAHDEPVTGLVGWITTLAVEGAWRGRGVASALVEGTVAAFADAGFEGAMIGVDAASPTGASRLYRDLGFVPVRRTACFSKQL